MPPTAEKTALIPLFLFNWVPDALFFTDLIIWSKNSGYELFPPENCSMPLLLLIMFMGILFVVPVADYYIEAPDAFLSLPDMNRLPKLKPRLYKSFVPESYVL